MTGELTLPESLMLLALDDGTGEHQGAFLETALAGAALAELVVRGKLAETEERPKRFRLVDVSPVGDAFLDKCLNVVGRKGADVDPKKLVDAIANTSGLMRPLFDALCARGVVERGTKPVFFLFNKTVYRTRDPSVENALRARLAAVIASDAPVETGDALLIAMAKRTGLLKRNFDPALLKDHKARINALAKGEGLAAGAAAKQIEAAQTALFVATVIVPAAAVVAS